MFNESAQDSIEEILGRSDAMMEVAEDGGPVRRVFNGRRHRPVGLFPSVKCDRMVAWESHLERRTIRWLEVDDTVVSFMEQPHRLYFITRGRRTHYTPDFRVQTAKAVYYVEVKYRDRLRKMKPDDRARLKRARAIYRSIGQNLVFVTDRRFNAQPVWHLNALEIEESRHFRPSHDEMTNLISHLSRRGVSTLGECAEAIGDRQDGHRRVMALMLHRIVSIDLSVALGTRSAIQLCPGYPDRLGDLIRRREPQDA